jgi:hypothetical protein
MDERTQRMGAAWAREERREGVPPLDPHLGTTCAIVPGGASLP